VKDEDLGVVREPKGRIKDESGHRSRETIMFVGTRQFLDIIF